MSTIRPLATITLLALVGVFLYMKINEKEPELPSEIADWSMPEGLDIGTSPAVPSFDNSAGSPSAAAPAFASTPATSGAGSSYSDLPPAFVPAAPTESAAAPTFDQAPPKFEPQAEATDAKPEELSVPDLPPLPTFPESETASSVPETPSAPAATEPPLDQPQTESTASSPAPTAPAAPEFAPVAASAPPAAPPQQTSLYSSTRLTVQSALDRGELSQGLLLLSDWYGDPSLTPEETQEVGNLLSQLAGSVIYSREHRLEAPYMVQAGEGLRSIAQKYQIPWQLLAKINGISDPDGLQPGQELKVVRGPFSAMIDLSERRLTLMLNRRYAGQFPLEIDPATSVEEGHWLVNQKLMTPAEIGMPGNSPTTPTENRSIMLHSVNAGSNQIVLIRGSNGGGPSSTDPAGRVLRMKSADVGDVYDILSLGSRVTIRR